MYVVFPFIMEQCEKILSFLSNSGWKMATEMYKMLETVSGNETISHFCVFKCFKKIQSETWGTLKMIQEVGGCQLLKIQKHLKIYELMAGEHGMTLELMKDQLHVNQEMICQILHEDSGKRKICMKFVTQSLMDEFILPC